MMSELEYTNNRFEHNYDIMEYFYFMKSPWATYKEDFKNQLLEVIIQIPKEQAKYFKLKKFLPSQKIIGEDEFDDPIFEDIGDTPKYIKLIEKHHQRITRNQRIQ